MNTLNLLKHFSTLTSTAVTQRALKKVLSKEKRLSFLEKTLQNSHLKRTTRLISRGYPEQMVEKVLSEVIYEYRKEALKQKTERTRSFYPSSSNFNRHYQI